MRVMVYKGEKQVSDLVSRAYEIEQPDAEALATATEEALRQANPLLGDLAGLPIGTLIRIPDVAGTRTTAAAQPLLFDARAALVGVRESLDGLGAFLETVAVRKTEAAREVLSVIERESLRDVLEHDPVAKAAVAQVALEAKERLSAAKALRNSRDLVLAQIENDLAGFEDILEQASASVAPPRSNLDLEG